MMYRCQGGYGGHSFQKANLVDKSLVESTILMLYFTDVREALMRISAGPDADIGALTAQAAAERTLLADLEDTFGDGQMSKAGYERNRAKITARLEAVEEQLRQATGDELLSEAAQWPDIEAAWGGLTIERRRALLRRLYSKIILYPARSALPWRVEPHPELPNHAAEIAAQLAVS